MTAPSSFYKQGVNNLFPYTPTPTGFYQANEKFNLVYYGALAAPPTLDPFGHAVIAGALYFDTVKGSLTVFDGVNWIPYTTAGTSIEFIIDGSGSTITTGTAGYIEVPFDCTIYQWTLLGDVVGSCVVDVQRCTFAAFAPPVHPAAGDSITDSTKPTLTAASSAQSSTLTGWTPILTKGDILGISVVSATTIQRATLSLKVARR